VLPVAAAAAAPAAVAAVHLRRFWLWWCDGLSVKDAFIIAVWVLYNAVWFSTILSKALARAGHEGLSPRGVGKGFASLMGPNVVLLLLPVAR